MKKTLLTSTIAVGLGVTGLATGHHADAAETTGANHAHLANLAQNNPSELNAKPVQEGSYNINFDQNNTNYHFSSNGQSWSWSYNGYGNQAANTQQEQPQQSEQAQPQQQTQQTQEQPKQQEQTQQSAQTQEQPKQQQAPQTEQTQQPQQESTSSSNESSSSDDSGSSVNVNGHLKQIAQRESGGDIHATNPSTGASGKYQFLQTTWDSVAPEQYKGQPASSAPESVQDKAAVKLYNTEGASQWVTA
ncbi:transglycosylase family protein [Staphylococcus sp. 18_1_E_LY]|uniref:Transglycosylase family protein n=1 Tax=Staphylococcus lloydii TaxID=2781774 RepID=A0A7T1B1N2_9STAP|nr:transglycosylase family protein [Staphylococcus lloydii]MBF7020658.1 transglycosylase family protein [Staphylococcus lloydii]MBF7028341.1 transglycosylase family protein [Staphylococcus lloydii]QPM75936.1 transglycosylase family protein [Staphylococcus lloydii]